MIALLDTSFLLPVFGVDIDVPDVRNQLLRLSRKFTLLINSLSILEAKWIILKLSRRKPEVLESFRDGLNLVVRGGEFRVVPFYLPEIDAVATDIYVHHRDYIDCSILASAYVEADLLVTLETKKMKDLASLFRPDYSSYRKLSSTLTIATLSEALETTEH